MKKGLTGETKSHLVRLEFVRLLLPNTLSFLPGIPGSIDTMKKVCCPVKEKNLGFSCMKKSFYLYWVLAMVATGCIQFKIDVLKPDLLTKIPLGEEPQKLNPGIRNNVLTNLPFYISHKSGIFYIPDNLHHVIKAFDSQGNLEFIIGNPESEYPPNIKQYKYKFSTIGHVSLDNEGNLYVQNRFGKREDFSSLLKEEDLYKRYSGMFDPTPATPLPSYIIKMTEKGTPLSILGARGKNTEPFRMIESIWTPSDGLLFVYHRMAEEMRLTSIRGESDAIEISESRLDIFRDSTYKDFRILIDRMIPHPEGVYALVSASFTNKSDNRFKYRRIFRVDFEEASKTNLIKEIQDPNEHLFSVLSNHEFYLWETENNGDSIRLLIHNEEGNHINNKRIPIEPPRSQWREVYTQGSDAIYAIRIRNGNLELYRWR